LDLNKEYRHKIMQEKQQVD